MVLFTLAIWLQPADGAIIPKAICSVGILSAISYSVFLLFGSRPPPGMEMADVLQPDILEQRPRLWIAPIREWLVFLTMIALLLGLSLALLKA